MNMQMNSYALGTAPRRHLTFKEVLRGFYNMCTIQIALKILWNREIKLLLADHFANFAENAIQAALKVEIDCQIVPEPIHAESATNSIL